MIPEWVAYNLVRGFPDGSASKEPVCRCRRWKRPGFHPWVGKVPWRRHGNPLQYPCLENPMDRGAGWATVYGVSELDMAECVYTHVSIGRRVGQGSS